MNSAWLTTNAHKIALGALVENFHSAVELLASVKHVALEDKVDSIHDKLFPLYYALLDDAKAIELLSLSGFLNQNYVVSRAFTERLINYCYLHIASSEEQERFFLYAHQKGVRQLNRTMKVGDTNPTMKYSGYEDIVKTPEVSAALNAFTSKGGKELTNWTVIPLPDRAALVEKFLDKEGILGLSLLTIYANASEALHGTIYGSVFHLGTYQPDSPRQEKSVQNIEVIVLSELGSLMIILILQMTAIFVLFSKINETDIKDIDTKIKSSMLNITRVVSQLSREKIN